MRRATAREASLLLDLLDRVDPHDAEAHNDLGVVFYRRGLTASALDAFAAAVVLDPAFATARRNLAVAAAPRDTLTPRLEGLRSQVEADPAASEPWVSLARLDYALGAADAAVAATDAAVARGATDPELPWIAVAALLDAGRLDEAARRLETAAAGDPSEARSARWRARLAYRRGEYRSALAHAEAAVARAPDDADAQLLRAFLHGDLGAAAAATQSYQAAVLLRPGLGRPEPHLALAVDQPAADPEGAPAEGSAMTMALARRALGIAALELGHVTVAEAALGAAFAEAPEARSAAALASIAMQRGDLEAAFGWFDRLVADRPQDAALWNARGVAAHQMGRWGDAETSYRRALAVVPDDVVCLNNLGVLLAQRGAPRDAAPLFARGAEVAPRERALRWNAALAQAAAGRPDAARPLLEGLASEPDAPEDAEVWYALARVRLADGALDAAWACAEQALVAAPADAPSWFLLARVAERRGHALGARQAVERALVDEPYLRAARYRVLTHDGVTGVRGGAPFVLGDGADAPDLRVDVHALAAAVAARRAASTRDVSSGGR